MITIIKEKEIVQEEAETTTYKCNECSAEFENSYKLKNILKTIYIVIS